MNSDHFNVVSFHIIIHKKCVLMRKPEYRNSKRSLVNFCCCNLLKF